MHSADILALVRKSKWRFLTKIAEASGLNPTTLRIALRRPQLRAELAIAKAVCRAPHELWPERWDQAGNRLVYRFGRSPSRMKSNVPATHRSARRAA